MEDMLAFRPRALTEKDVNGVIVALMGHSFPPAEMSLRASHYSKSTYTRARMRAIVVARMHADALRFRAVTAPDADPNKVNWSIRLDGDEVGQWDELLYSLRRETGRRTLSKADIMRALVDLASDESAPVRSALTATLRQRTG
ncbi:hypothetical protein KL864_33950 [Mycolicibacterium goodii]|uniref:hypothetical protein n=1 Tax=Mycolicibacterium goodii TaxID=134601 RepID=UPI001BDC5842|nr:hypothetical protein [Mycolicibacterium goodii]MBU8820871.1 hypothetical protein [Mycolicibacterium goodii]